MYTLLRISECAKIYVTKQSAERALYRKFSLETLASRDKPPFSDDLTLNASITLLNSTSTDFIFFRVIEAYEFIDYWSIINFFHRGHPLTVHFIQWQQWIEINNSIYSKTSLIWTPSGPKKTVHYTEVFTLERCISSKNWFLGLFESVHNKEVFILERCSLWEVLLYWYSNKSYWSNSRSWYLLVFEQMENK